MALADTSGIVARPVGQSPTATNAHDLVTSERGGPSHVYYIIIVININKVKNGKAFSNTIYRNRFNY
jgi:hypothetical protein